MRCLLVPCRYYLGNTNLRRSCTTARALQIGPSSGRRAGQEAGRAAAEAWDGLRLPNITSSSSSEAEHFAHPLLKPSSLSEGLHHGALKPVRQTRIEEQSAKRLRSLECASCPNDRPAARRISSAFAGIFRGSGPQWRLAGAEDSMLHGTGAKPSQTEREVAQLTVREALPFTASLPNSSFFCSGLGNFPVCLSFRSLAKPALPPGRGLDDTLALGAGAVRSRILPSACRKPTF